MTEYVYHVNENDEIVRKVSRGRAHAQGLLHRTGIVFLMNTQQRILICVRSAEKSTFPSRYDASASFHVTHGETYADAAQRELWEEIRIDAPLHYLGKFRHHDPPEHQLVAMFRCLSNAQPTVDQSEFSSHQFCELTMSNA